MVFLHLTPPPSCLRPAPLEEDVAGCSDSDVPEMLYMFSRFQRLKTFFNVHGLIDQISEVENVLQCERQRCTNQLPMRVMVSERVNALTIFFLIVGQARTVGK